MVRESDSVVSNSLRPREPYSPWNFPSQNTGVDSLSLLQGIFLSQGLNPGLLHCRWILYQLSHQGSLCVCMCVCIIYVCMYVYVWSGRKWKWKSLSRVQLFATPWTISPWNSLGQNTGVGSLSLLQGIFPTQGSNPGLPTLQEDSLPAEPQGKSTNTGVCSLSLLQGIFLTQELNWGFLHCRWILYHLSYQGIPKTYIPISNYLKCKQTKGTNQKMEWENG